MDSDYDCESAIPRFDSFSSIDIPSGLTDQSVYRAEIEKNRNTRMFIISLKHVKKFKNGKYKSNSKRYSFPVNLVKQVIESFAKLTNADHIDNHYDSDLQDDRPVFHRIQIKKSPTENNKIVNIAEYFKSFRDGKDHSNHRSFSFPLDKLNEFINAMKSLNNHIKEHHIGNGQQCYAWLANDDSNLFSCEMKTLWKLEQAYNGRFMDHLRRLYNDGTLLKYRFEEDPKFQLIQTLSTTLC